MRDIKWRGISTETNEWVYGSLIVDKKEAFILNGVIEATDEYIAIEDWRPVKIETVGQYIGSKDKNGVEIYEKDILETPYEYHGNPLEEGSSGLYRGLVRYRPSTGFIQTKALVKDDEEENWIARKYLGIRSTTATVIGNFYQNPELLRL